MLKEICRIYNIGSLPIHTLKSYPLQRSLAYTNYYRLTSQKVLESHSCVTGMAFSVLPTFKILYPPLQEVNILRLEAKCVQKQTGLLAPLDMVLTLDIRHGLTHLEEELRTRCTSLFVGLYCNLTSCA